MFSLDNTCRYWLYNKPVDMRKSFNGLSGIVTNAMCERLRSGDVFIFANASRNMMKLLRQEDSLVFYFRATDRKSQRLAASRIQLNESGSNLPELRKSCCHLHITPCHLYVLRRRLTSYFVQEELNSKRNKSRGSIRPRLL